jgi:hypothetical protein
VKEYRKTFTPFIAVDSPAPFLREVIREPTENCLVSPVEEKLLASALPAYLQIPSAVNK